MLLNSADYKHTTALTPQDDLKAVLEAIPADEAVTLARGTYTSANPITLRQQNFHLYVAEADVGFVFIQAPFIIESVQRARFTGIDFKSLDAASCHWLLGGQTFFTDCCWKHTLGTVPNGGGAIASEFNRLYISSDLRNSVIDFLTETTKGQPVMCKDGGYFRTTASDNAWRTQVKFGFGIGVQIAGCGTFIANLDIFGPGKFTATTGLEIARGGGHGFYLKTLNSPVGLIQDCGTGILTQSGGTLTIRNSKTTPLLIKDCNKGVQTTEGGRMHLVSDWSIKYQNVNVRITQDRDEVIYQ